MKLIFNFIDKHITLTKPSIFKKKLSSVFVLLASLKFSRYPFALLVAYYLKMRSSSFSDGAKAGRIVLFALSRRRIKTDAIALAETGNFQILSWPDNDQFFIQHRFLNSLDRKYFMKDEMSSEEKTAERNLQDFLNLMFPIFLKLISAKAVIGANFWYKQDIRFGRAAQDNNIPYIVFFKESLKITKFEQDSILLMCKRLGCFGGERILTHNQSIANLIIKSGYCAPEQIGVSGAIRMSSFIKRCVNSSGENDVKVNGNISLFSFNPGLSLNGLAMPPWPKNPYKGWVRFFEAVHSCFAQAALQKPEKRFIIKTKYDGLWHKRIEEACFARNLNIAEIPNLTLIHEQSAHDIIFNSSVIVSFASTTLLESGLAKKHVIIPDFEETIDPYYRKHIKLLDFYPLAQVATSREELISRICYMADSDKTIPPTIQKKRNSLFETYVASVKNDPLAIAVEEINSIVKKFAKIRQEANEAKM